MMTFQKSYYNVRESKHTKRMCEQFKLSKQKIRPKRIAIEKCPILQSPFTTLESDILGPCIGCTKLPVLNHVY